MCRARSARGSRPRTAQEVELARTATRRAPRPRRAAARSRLKGPEAKARYSFRDRGLLLTALTHGSYLHEHPEEKAADFERLEFLGDAVIDLVVGDYLYRRFPKLHEGELTALRASLVSGNALAPVGTRLGLPEAARLGRGEEESGGRERQGLAASLFEAFIGAVYLDSGYEAASEVGERVLSRELRSARSGPMKSPKSMLQEWVQAQRLPLPVYRTVDVTGPEHRREFVVAVEIDGRSATGVGTSKRDAEEAAAAELLAELTS